MLSALLLSGCAGIFPYATVRGTRLRVENPNERTAVAKVTCSCRVFEGEYDKYVWLKPFEVKVIDLSSSHWHGNSRVVCTVESFEFKTPAEEALDVKQVRK